MRNTLLLITVIIFFLFPISKAAGSLGSAFILFIGFWFFINDLKKKKINNDIFLIGIPFILIFLLAALGTTHGKADWNYKFDYIIKSLRYPTIFFGAYFIYRLDLRSFAIKSFSASIALTLCMVYASTVIVLPWAPHVPKMWGGDHTMWGDYITQNIMVSFFSVWMLHQAIQNSRRSLKIIYSSLFVLAAVAVLALSYGRTGYVMLLAAFLIYCFFRFDDWRWRVAACLATVLTLAVLYFGVDAFQIRVNQGITEILNADGKNSLTSIGARLFMWSTAWNMGLDSLWWGVGSGSYSLEWCAVLNDHDWCLVGEHPHNNFLLLFASNGVFSVLTYILILIAACWAIYKKNTFEPELLLIFLTILVTDSLLNGPFWNIREANFFTLMGAPVLSAVFKKINSLQTHERTGGASQEKALSS